MGGSESTVKFEDIEESIATGDLALLQRHGQDKPHFAIFIQHEKDEPDFPLLLAKSKTKPLKAESFDPNRPRDFHTASAIDRIFYGDFNSVAVRHLKIGESISSAKAIETIEKVQQTSYSEEELDAIKAATSDAHRSSIIGTFMVAHFYKYLGVLSKDPNTITPDTLQDALRLSKPSFIKLPPVKEGPVATGDPPFLVDLLDGIKPLPDVTTKPFESIVADGLQTGDIVLLSGATNSGAIIRFFTDSLYSHCGVVLKSQQLLIWEASTNKAGLVDLQSGKVMKGVELLPLKQKIFSGWYSLVAIRRLTGIDDEKRTEMYKELLKFRKEVEGRPYEKDNIELALSALDFHEDYLTFLKNEEEDLSSLFCSEFVAEVYQRMGLLTTDKTSNEYTPDDFCSKNQLALNFGELGPEVYVELKFDTSSEDPPPEQQLEA